MIGATLLHVTSYKSVLILIHLVLEQYLTFGQPFNYFLSTCFPYTQRMIYYLHIDYGKKSVYQSYKEINLHIMFNSFESTFLYVQICIIWLVCRKNAKKSKNLWESNDKSFYFDVNLSCPHFSIAYWDQRWRSE